MNKICDNYPDFCLPFSPNWYLPQIVSIDKTSHNMAFGVNNTVFIMNYSLKIPITTLICDKNLPIHSKKNESSESKPQNSKSLDDKITSILIYQQFVIAGFENSYLSIWIMDKNLNETRQIVLKQYQFLNQILFIVPLKLKEHEEKIICVDLQGISLIITFNEKEILNEELRKINLEKPEENIKIKLINFKKIFDEYFLFVFNSGKIQVWPQNFEILITEIDIKKKILYFDSILSHENNIETLKILCITKEHSKNTLYSTFLSKDDIEYNYKAKKNPSLKEELSKASQVLPNIQYEVKLDFHLTETYIHNKEDLKQASLCVKWLNSSEVLFYSDLYKF